VSPQTTLTTSSLDGSPHHLRVQTAALIIEAGDLDRAVAGFPIAQESASINEKVESDPLESFLPP
jgi:hypothetical protein